MSTEATKQVNISTATRSVDNLQRNISRKKCEIFVILIVVSLILALYGSWRLKLFHQSKLFPDGETPISVSKKHRLKNCYYTTNFWKYDALRAPSTGLPTDFYRIYVTDQNDSETSKHLISLGWNEVFVVNLSDRNPFDRRMFTTQARMFPELFAPLTACERVFFTDADIIAIESSRYETWVRSMKYTTALLIMVGHYNGERDDIDVELRISLSQERWRYSWTKMTNRTRYYQRLIYTKTNSTRARVASAKYLGWNMKHPNRRAVAEWLLNEASIHVQGNIAISAAVILFPHLVQAENCSLWANLGAHQQIY